MNNFVLKIIIIYLFLFSINLYSQTRRYFEFVIFPDYNSSDNFIACTSDIDVLSEVDSQLAMPLSGRYLHINGPIDYGNGGHNLVWSWHFIPDDWILTSSSIEICDGSPSDVEANLTYWIDTIGCFCPWNSRVFREIFPSSTREFELRPEKFLLLQNYPNPFNPTTIIGFRIIPASGGGFVSLKVYDVLGNEITTLVNEELPAGEYEVEFSAIGGSASDGNTYNLPSGIYFYKLSIGNKSQVKKMILLR